MMQLTPDTPPNTSEPLIPEVYILWHPKCELGQQMATRLYEWLRPGHGLGPEVFYRSLPAPESPPDGLPSPLPGDTPTSATTPHTLPGGRPTANLQIVVMLIDDNMVADYSWRHYLEQIGRRHVGRMRRHIFPVALDPTAFNAPGLINHRNFIRPAGLPLAATQEPARSVGLSIAIKSLLNQVTQAMCRLLLAPLPNEVVSDPNLRGVAPKLAIFLSHAKMDGTVPAKRIRDFIYANTQLAAFFDENDIPLGDAFGRVIDSIVMSESTAALIAVVSQNYATRAWCRRELSTFRRPRMEKPRDATGEQWRLPPIIVVDALEPGALTTNIAETGSSTVIRWSQEAVDIDEQIVATVLRDALLAIFHSALGRSLNARPDQIVINWLPDPTTLLHIDSIRRRQGPVEVLYPGRGLAGFELDILEDLFPGVYFHNFDQLVPVLDESGTAGKYRSQENLAQLIGFSISFDQKDLLARGFGLEHLTDLLIRLARPILRTGANLAYAGAWNEHKGNFTYDLLKLMSTEQEDSGLEDNGLGGPGQHLKVGRLWNHLAWPHYLPVSSRTEAQWVNSCRIIRVSQQQAGIPAERIVRDDVASDSDEFLLNSAITLSQMRWMAVDGGQLLVPSVAESYAVPPISARIVLGGKTSHYSGFLPGIFEESLLTLEKERPLYILGGFGGAAEVLARYLLGEERPELTLDWLEKHTPRLSKLRMLASAWLPPGLRSSEAILHALRRKLDQIRPNLSAGLNTGLSEEETRELLTTRDMSQAVKLVLKGLSRSLHLAIRRT